MGRCWGGRQRAPGTVYRGGREHAVRSDILVRYRGRCMLSVADAPRLKGSRMNEVMQQLGGQLFWLLVIAIAGVMGAGLYRVNHRGSKTRMQALTGKGSDDKAAEAARKRPKPRPKKKR